MIKGFTVINTCRYILETPSLRAKLASTVTQQVEALRAQVSVSEWRPRSELLGLWHIIADSADPQTEQSVYDALVRCGEETGHYSTNTFFRLLMKVLTPKMFAMRFPEFYRRDQMGGEGIVEEVGSKHVALLVRGIKGYDHFGPITVGFAGVPFRGMGLKNVRIKCTPWSLAEPGPDEVRFRVDWD